MTDDEVARMLAESLAMHLATCPATLCDDAARGGMHPRLVAGVRAARDAFVEHVTENDAAQLLADIKAEVRDGLADLDRRHGRRHDA